MSTLVNKFARKRPPRVTQYEVPQYREVVLTAAEVIASNSTYPEIIPAPGAGKAIVLCADPVLNIFGGTTDYDQDGDSTLGYTDNTGSKCLTAAVDDFLNDGTAGSVCRMGLLDSTTVINTSVNEPVVYVMTASPKNAAGDRLLRVQVWYRVIDVQT